MFLAMQYKLNEHRKKVLGNDGQISWSWQSPLICKERQNLESESGGKLHCGRLFLINTRMEDNPGN